MRFGLLAALFGLAWSFVMFRQRNAEGLERDREQLLQRVRRESSGLSEAERMLTNRIQPWLREMAGDYAGDYVTEELREPAAFSYTIARPIVYVRGPIASFSNAERQVEMASASFRDAFILCLLDPPESRSEKALLARARDALAGGARASRAAHVERLHHALVGLPFLTMPWELRLIMAKSRREVGTLQRTFERAPIRDAKRAARAEFLLSVADEPSDGSGPTELDGECPHHVRLELRDLKTEEVLVRLRRHVNPAWISPAVRPEYAGGIDSCRLALDVREELSSPRSGLARP